MQAGPLEIEVSCIITQCYSTTPTTHKTLSYEAFQPHFVIILFLYPQVVICSTFKAIHWLYFTSSFSYARFNDGIGYSMIC